MDPTAAHILIAGGMKWRPPGPSGYYPKYISVGANDHHHHQPPPPAIIPATNPFPPVPDDGFFSFEQLAGGTAAAAAMECKMEEELSSSVDCYEAAAMADLDLWDY